jgi:hypothetical protein
MILHKRSQRPSISERRTQLDPQSGHTTPLYVTRNDILAILANFTRHDRTPLVGHFRNTPTYSRQTAPWRSRLIRWGPFCYRAATARERCFDTPAEYVTVIPKRCTLGRKTVIGIRHRCKRTRRHEPCRAFRGGGAGTAARTVARSLGASGPTAAIA